MKKKILIGMVVIASILSLFYLSDKNTEDDDIDIRNSSSRTYGIQLPEEDDKSDIKIKYPDDGEYTIFDSYWYAYNVASTSYDNYILTPVTSLSYRFRNDDIHLNSEGRTTYRFQKVYYTYLDIDKDGTDELIFTTQGKDDNTEPLYYIDAIYRHIDGGLKKVKEIQINSEGRYGGLSGTYEYERLIDNNEGETLYLTEDNHIVYEKDEKTITYELAGSKLKESSTDSQIRKEYDWTLLTDPNHNREKIKNEYTRIIYEVGDDARFDILRMYDENIELYVHKVGERTGKIIRYDGNKKSEIEVYAPISDGHYLGILIYRPMKNVLETSYIICKYRFKKILNVDMTTLVRNYNRIDYVEEVIKQYTIDKNGTWRLRGEASYINQEEKIDNAYYEYADEFEEYISAFQPEELTKEEVLYLLEKF